jgi:hypothetical protein
MFSLYVAWHFEMALWLADAWHELTTQRAQKKHWEGGRLGFP